MIEIVPSSSVSTVAFSIVAIYGLDKITFTVKGEAMGAILAKNVVYEKIVIVL